MRDGQREIAGDCQTEKERHFTENRNGDMKKKYEKIHNERHVKLKCSVIITSPSPLKERPLKYKSRHHTIKKRHANTRRMYQSQLIFL